MFCRLPFSYETIIKFLLIIVLGVLLLNIYILSILFGSEKVKTRPKFLKQNDEVYIKAEPFKQSKGIHNVNQSPKKAVFVQINTTDLATKKILEKVAVLERQNFGQFFPAKIKRYHQAVLHDVKVTEPFSTELLKDSFKWTSGRQLFPEPMIPPLGRLLNSLCSSKVEKADNMAQGTQLKLLLTLEGGLKAVFKPQWYKRTEVIAGSVYAGKDRHNGEVAAFHLSWLLGLRRAPLTVGRRIDLRQEVMPVATNELLKTFDQEDNNTCFYGVCHYCGPHDPVCASGQVLEGSLILWLPEEFPLKKFRHPWQRTYKPNIPARWELDAGYCQVVRKSEMYSTGPRLLDIIDTAVFDFLIGNGDRHHYEVFQNINDSAVLFIDNGKSFGNPYVDHIDILAPLYQCCRLRSTTWTRLLWLQMKTISEPLREVLEWSHIAPVLSDAHLTALDRRLLVTIAAVHLCFTERNGQHNVIVND
ncbi:glycosaminoglycan xylosylkinase [Macrosteles quadrilineatus]|uniref:glycosaminoglycan xylosylkinase n=1 Tax=Macrosteles quadrilineatus TaxID=74068 RepID=UPI0023E163CC|nr:glycosaminoglycan xylosylkinase [Macrosteles quadrilineatus]